MALTFPLIIIAYEYFLPQQPLPFGERDRVRGRVKSIFWMLIIFAIPAVIYFYLRSLGVSEVDIGIRKTMGITDKISSGLFVDFAASVGFYLKKLIYPFPLNFAIVEINKGLYFIIGAIFLVFLIFQLLNSS
ncbi:MAG: hypothetical protein HY279_14870, partial [Nitrospinae bacterium]|nr:hypothetical protein [Nitrospinota bacterium]